MSRIAWPSLMRLGLCELGLAPAVFWDLTPAELFVLAGLGPDRGPMGRTDLEALMRRFPDAPRARPKQAE